MSYGKYGMKMKVDNIEMPITNDPWFNFGSLLGTIWGANYNKRGIEKGEKEALAAADSLAGNAPAQNSYVPENLYQQYRSANGQLGLPENKTKAGSALNDDNAYVNASKQMGIPQSRDLKAEKLDYLARKYGGQTPNPDGDALAINTMSGTAKTALQDADLSKLPVRSLSDYQSAIRKELRKNGRSDYQIEQIMNNITPTLQAKVQEGNDKVFGQMYGVLNQQIQNGELDNASMTWAKMSQLNPTMAKALEPKMQRAWKNYNAQDEIDRMTSLYMQNDPSLSKQEARNLSIYKSVYSPKEQAAMGITVGRNGTVRSVGSGRSGGSGSSKKTSIFSDPDYKGVVALANDYQKQLDGFDESAYASPAEAQAARNRLTQNMYYYQAVAEQMLEDSGFRPGGISAAGEGKPNSAEKEQKKEEEKLPERPLSDAAEEQRQREYNRNQAVQAAQRAGLSINPYTGTVSMASPYDNPTPEQREAYRQWYERYGYLFE